jgi:hypothetical protein
MPQSYAMIAAIFVKYAARNLNFATRLTTPGSGAERSA